MESFCYWRLLFVSMGSTINCGLFLLLSTFIEPMALSTESPFRGAGELFSAEKSSRTGVSTTSFSFCSFYCLYSSHYCSSPSVILTWQLRIGFLKAYLASFRRWIALALANFAFLRASSLGSLLTKLIELRFARPLWWIGPENKSSPL